jgi:hypothetical protein
MIAWSLRRQLRCAQIRRIAGQLTSAASSPDRPRKLAAFSCASSVSLALCPIRSVVAISSRNENCAPAYHSEVHHRTADWAAGGLTDIDDETLACGTDNRRVTPGGWTTRKRKDGRTEWIPPPNLDTGQTRVNNYHHPQRYLIPDDGDDAGDRGEDDADC